MKFSCIIPTYNCGKHIEKMVEQLTSCVSVMLEVIVVDDGSTDNTKELLDKYTHKNFKYILLENSGVSVARNTGIEVATGDYLIFFDADDEINIDDLNEVLRFIMLDTNKSDIYMTGYQILSGRDVKKVSVPYPKGYYTREVLEKLRYRLIDVKIAKHYTAKYIGGKVYQYFVKKEMFEKGLKFQKNIYFAEDLCYCMQMFYLASDITFLNLYPYRYNVIEGSASHRYRQNLWDEWVEVYKFVESYLQGEEQLNKLVYWAGKNSIRHYTMFQTYKNRKQEIKKIVNSETFEKAIQDISFSDWTLNERIENFLIRKKWVWALYLFEKMIIVVKNMDRNE